MCLSQGLVLVRNEMCGRKKFWSRKERERRTKEEIEWNEKKYAHLILEVDCLSFSFFFWVCFLSSTTLMSLCLIRLQEERKQWRKTHPFGFSQNQTRLQMDPWT